jgi:hypothetical protein
VGCLARFVFLGAKLRKRLAAVGELHQFAGAAGADVDRLEQRFPLGPGAVMPVMLGLELLEVLAGGDVVPLGLVLSLVAGGDVRLDRADQRCLCFGTGDRLRSFCRCVHRLDQVERSLRFAAALFGTGFKMLGASALREAPAAIVCARALVVGFHWSTSLSWPRVAVAPGPFSFENCGYGGSLRGDRARLLVAAGARQPSKKLAQVVIGDERATPELARHEVSVADRGVHGISAEAG